MTDLAIIRKALEDANADFTASIPFDSTSRYYLLARQCREALSALARLEAQQAEWWQPIVGLSSDELLLEWPRCKFSFTEDGVGYALRSGGEWIAGIHDTDGGEWDRRMVLQDIMEAIVAPSPPAKGEGGG